MDVGVFLPVSGRAATGVNLINAARKAEEWGYASVWAADRVVMPWQIDTPYPYADGSGFIVPPDRPFLECLTVLSFLAGATERIKLGVSVMVMPYRHPLNWARIVTTIDSLSEGRFLLGVGIGWMEEEFRALGADFAARGRVGDEHLEVLRVLLSEEHCSYHGAFYDFDDVAFLPKAHRGRLGVWIGGEGRPAQRRAGRYGDAWFPYFVRITPEELLSRFEHVRSVAAESGRDPDTLALHCCLPVEITDEQVSQDPDRLRGTPSQVRDALARFAEIGVGHVGLQFMVPRYPQRMGQIERFGDESLVELRAIRPE